MTAYKLASFGVIRLSDKASIPPDEGNRDWREYQSWLDAGNVPVPADPAPPAVIEVEAFRVKKLLRDNNAYSTLDAAIPAGTEERFYWENAPTFRSNHAFVQQFAPGIGLDTQAKIDAFFVTARDMAL